MIITIEFTLHTKWEKNSFHEPITHIHIDLGLAFAVYVAAKPAYAAGDGGRRCCLVM